MDKVRAKANESVRWDILRSFFFFLLADGIMGCRDGMVTRSEALEFWTHSIFSFFDKLSKEIDLLRRTYWRSNLGQQRCLQGGCQCTTCYGTGARFFFSFLFTVIIFRLRCKLAVVSLYAKLVPYAIVCHNIKLWNLSRFVLSQDLFGMEMFCLKICSIDPLSTPPIPPNPIWIFVWTVVS
jgi:hypothetical protein